MHFVGESYDGRVAVPSISREGVAEKSCRVIATQSIIKVTEQSAGFPRPKSRRLHGVHGAPCDWGITLYSLCSERPKKLG